jgi:hypothetical protein
MPAGSGAIAALAVAPIETERALDRPWAAQVRPEAVDRRAASAAARGAAPSDRVACALHRGPSTAPGASADRGRCSAAPGPIKERSDMRFSTLSLVTSLAASALLAAPAFADDAKDYTGAFCFDRSAVASRVVVSGSGVALNDADDEIGFICPAVKDHNMIVAAVAYVVDERDDAAVECKLRTVRHDLTDTNVLAKNTGTVQHGNAPVPLVFGALFAGSQAGYVLHCVVPGKDAATGLRSGIVMYEIDEND